MRFCIFSAVAALLCASVPGWASPAPTEILGGRSLADSKWVQVSTKDSLTVVVFVSARCPCSISHEETLKKLVGEFKQVKFIGVHSNVDEPAAESAKHFAVAGLPFPIIQDNHAELADRYGALKTPHVFVLAKSGEVLYQGGVGDCHNGNETKKAYLKDALSAIVAGRVPENTKTRSLGCVIRRS